jgi:hypothetical protein
MNFNRSIVLGIVLLWWPCIGQAQPNNELQERCRKQAEELFHKTFKSLPNARSGVRTRAHLCHVRTQLRAEAIQHWVLI